MYRGRRLRRNPAIRNLVQETVLRAQDFVAPLFVVYGENVKEEISSMPGQFRFSVDRLGEEIAELQEAGVQAVILFGIPREKDPEGTGAWQDEGEVQRAVRMIKKDFPQIYVITDVCMCEYTSHGHCGVIHDHDVDNDATLNLLSQTAVSHARAGADMVAPSDMMDGRIAAIREALDGAGFESVPIMSYAVKYASAFYGPFREAADSTPAFGDRRSYQMDPANVREGMREAAADTLEGADVLMVKPALSYLDVIHALKGETRLPVAAYNVSGEYAMVMAAAEKGWIDGERVMMESLLSMKRAGADIILTYFAKRAAQLLKQ
jgi:porphobilinogen synthase